MRRLISPRDISPCSQDKHLEMSWSPDQAKLNQVGELLQACSDPSNHDRHVQALQVGLPSSYCVGREARQNLFWCGLQEKDARPWQRPPISNLAPGHPQMLDQGKREMPDFGCYMLLVGIFPHTQLASCSNKPSRLQHARTLRNQTSITTHTHA